MEPKLTEAQTNILFHALGIDLDRRFVPYRDYYAANAGDADVEALATAGLFRSCGSRDWLGGLVSYRVTEQGKAHGRALHSEALRALPQKTLAQKRYQLFLREDSSLSFGEWLKGKRYKQ